MNIGLIARTASKAYKAAKAGAKKVAKTKAAKKVTSAAKKTAEGVGYVATPGLKRGARGAYTRRGRRGFIPRSQVQRTGAKVIGGGAAIGAGATGAKVVSGRRKRASAARDSGSTKATKPTTTKAKKPSGTPIKFGVKLAATGAGAGAVKKKTSAKVVSRPAPTTTKAPAKKKLAKAMTVKGAAQRGADMMGRKFDKMTTAQKNRLRGKDAIAYRRYLKSKKK